MPDLNANKTLVAFVGAVIAFATEVVTSPAPRPTSAEWLHFGVGLAIAGGVYQVANAPRRRARKRAQLVDEPGDLTAVDATGHAS